MATLNDQGREYAQANESARLLPVDVDTWASIAASAAFGPFEPGDHVTIVNDAPAHVNAGDGDVAATAANPQLPAGERDYVVPDGCTHVALFGDGSGNGCVFKTA